MSVICSDVVVKKSGASKKLRLSDKQPQIFNSGDMGAQGFNFASEFSHIFDSQRRKFGIFGGIKI